MTTPEESEEMKIYSFDARVSAILHVPAETETEARAKLAELVANLFIDEATLDQSADDVVCFEVRERDY